MDFVRSENNRNPDLWELSVDEDFHKYGVLDLLNHAIAKLYDRITHGDWDEAYIVLEALTTMMTNQPKWLDCDEERVGPFTRLYGACAYAVLRQLKTDDCLTSQCRPSLEALLKNIGRCGDESEGSPPLLQCSTLCKAIGKRLFSGDDPQAKWTLELSRLHEWAQTLKEPRYTTMQAVLEDRAREGVPNPWFRDGDVGNEDYSNYPHDLSQTWGAYEGLMDLWPSVIDCDAPHWDINRWTPEEREPFEYGD
ncbi:hypothetical protein BDN72DRAFT_837152 [Pluteus cervinus]|uniref:Uncharacterized protein n=1 Tax=Pluteus cervinus TaxID=181527 RepID=A0ACD3B1K4_9AGAR|nr:hypothetical protein BDN72DRAFT_837152 [Pluteus cervinus]